LCEQLGGQLDGHQWLYGVTTPGREDFWGNGETGCGGLTLAGGQVSTKATLSLLSSAGQGRENVMKGS